MHCLSFKATNRELQRWGAAVKEGWAQDKHHGRRHYFRNGWSLCGKVWLLVEPQRPPAKESWTCCRECFLRLVAESKLLRGKRT